jgi:gliding motility-associated-like protein
MYIALEVSNTIGCTDTILKTFEVADLPQFSITGNTYLCAGNSGSPLSITGFPSWSVQWSPARYFDSPNSYITIIRPDSSTYITATATNGNGCSVSQSLMVTVLEAPDLSWSPNDTTIIIGDTVQLHIRSDIENSAYVWSPDYQISCTTCNDPYARPFESTVYRVDVTDECGTSTVEIFVEVIADHYLELPNAFTPNGDSQNDVFMFESGNIREAEFSIFNRWGNLVYSSNSLTEGWNGYFQGKLQNTDTYTYYIRAVTVHGFEFEKKGTFLLLR